MEQQPTELKQEKKPSSLLNKPDSQENIAKTVSSEGEREQLAYYLDRLNFYLTYPQHIAFHPTLYYQYKTKYLELINSLKETDIENMNFIKGHCIYFYNKLKPENEQPIKEYHELFLLCLAKYLKMVPPLKDIDTKDMNFIENICKFAYNKYPEHVIPGGKYEIIYNKLDLIEHRYTFPESHLNTPN